VAAGHVDAAVVFEDHALPFEQGSLAAFEYVVGGEGAVAFDYAMAGEAEIFGDVAHGATDGAGGADFSGEQRHHAVAGDFSSGDFPHHAVDAILEGQGIFHGQSMIQLLAATQR
jgi:hypothetical protein